MKRRLSTMLVVLSLTSALAFAQGTPSSKATAAINTSVGCTYSGTTTLGDILVPSNCHDIFTGAAVPVTPDSFVEIMSSTVKLSNSQSLFVNPSLITGLYTNTKVKSSPGSGASTAQAMGGVYLRAVLYDSNGNAIIAEPVKRCDADILGCYADANGNKGVVLDSRVQTLSQEISQCIVQVGDQTGSCTFDLTTQLILQTTSAHSFGFIFPNVGQGVYKLSIQTAVNSNAVVNGSGSAIGAAAYGLGSVTAESVRLVHDFSF